VKKRLIALLAIIFTIGIGWAVVEQALHVNQFGGMMKDVDPLALEDSMAADSENVITDLGNGIQPRDGYIAYSTEPSKALWVFAKSDGTRYLITHSGDSLKADSGNKTFATVISTVAPSIVTAGSQLGDYFYFCNTVDGLKRWDGATVTIASATMTANQLVTWKGRLVAAGKPSYERTLFISRYLDGTAWNLATDPSDDDPSQITVGGSLDENITGLYASYKDLLIWFKNTSFGGLFGSRRSNFALRTFSESVGTNHPGTVRDCDGLLRFLGPRRTVWEFDGSNLTKISEGNNELFDAIINGESNSRTATVTSQTDYDAGTNTQTNSSVAPGSVMLSTWSRIDTTQGDFDSGTSSMYSIYAAVRSKSDGSIQLNHGYINVSDANAPNYSFESGSGSDASNWTEGGTWGRYATLPYSGTYSMASNGGTGYTVSFCQNAGSCTNESKTATGSWLGESIDLTSVVGSYGYFKFTDSLGGVVSSDSFYLTDDRTPCCSFSYEVMHDGSKLKVDIVGPMSQTLITSGTYTSQTFNTNMSSPSWTSSAATYSTNGNNISFETQTSTDGATWGSASTWTSGNRPVSPSQKYIRYRALFSMTTSSLGFPNVSDVTLSARQSSGTFVSANQSIGSAISSWNVFQRDETLNDGTITYGFYTDSNATKTIGGDGLPVAGTYTSSQTITNNTIPTISTAPYAFFSAKFDITASTQNPTNDRMSITWDEGSSLKAKSVWTKQRYWLSTSRASTAYNDTVFVYDRQKQWQRYTGLNALDIQLHNSYPMIGSSGGIIQGEIGTSDAGAAITSSYTTKYFFPNGAEMRAYLRDLWMTTTRSDATLSTYLYHDGAATPITLGAFVMNGQEGYQVKKLPIPAGDLQLVRHVAIKWNVSGTERWKILNGSLYFDPDTQRE